MFIFIRITNAIFKGRLKPDYILSLVFDKHMVSNESSFSLFFTSSFVISKEK